MNNYRPSRAEINAAHLLHAPFTKKEKEMPNTNAKKDETKEEGLVKQTAASVPAPLPDESLALAGIAPEALEELEQIERELSVGFKHTSARKVLARDEPFKIIDAVFTTMEEEIDAVVNGTRTKIKEEKPKIVWVLEMQSGEILTCMQSFGNIRSKYLNYLNAARRNKLRAEIGPMKFMTVPMNGKQPEDAIVFDTSLSGFGFRKFPLALTA